MLLYVVRMSRGGARRSKRQNRFPGSPVSEPPVVLRKAETAVRLVYSRAQAAEALGVSTATLARRVLPHIDTVEMPWGARMIPVDELERLVTEGRRPKLTERPQPAGRRPGIPPEVRRRICAEHAAGSSLADIARALNRDQVPTSQGGHKWWPSTVKAVLDRSSPPDVVLGSGGAGLSLRQSGKSPERPTVRQSRPEERTPLVARHPTA